ncbi:MAG: SGNH/GDSL hydrolase family protein [Lentisphaerae bacterium]|nr:SGNH/GDSL hydrolase family protein [Lentisphaerota bacterium]
MKKAVTLIGDSIRMGYQETVRVQLSAWADVWGPVENGGTSRNVLDHLDEWVISRPPDILHINCGLHDLRRDFGQSVSAIPLRQYEENVRAILRRLKTETQATIIWASTTPVNQDWHHRNKGFDRMEADVAAYNAAARKVAEQWGVPIDDLFAAVQQAGRDSLLRPDGVHFTPDGCDLLGRTVAKFIESACRSA